MSRFDVKKIPARILIVDDHPIVRAGFVSVLEADPDLSVCGEADTMQAALDLARDLLPDLLLLDLTLEDRNGLELIKRLKGDQKDLKILVCSIHDETIYAERVIAAGALGYINKQEAVTHITDAVRQTLAGKIYLSDEMKERVIIGLTPARSADASPLDELSNREIEVFELIGAGIPTARIAERLHLSVKTIESHREKIKRKLGLASGSELVRHAVQWQLEQG